MTIRANYHNYQEKQENRVEVADYQLNLIKEGNYHFTREEIVNDISTLFVGDSNHNRSEVLMTRQQQVAHYFLYSDIVLLKTSQNYQVADQPYLFPQLSIYKYIHSILKQATITSKTVNNMGGKTYHLTISTTTLGAILDGMKLDIADPVNEIILETNEEKEVVKITYQLNSYASYLLGQPSRVKVLLSYSDFGTIEDLEIPQ